ncbi:DUF4407 domain-containing protein [Marivirga sp. S37H4]|uniref:DUF4407 domain-containing protein n=1 Tax=Marivirga aurantiaca TaxID=2802615 RepID=A0A934WYA3_9BACT|nr:DUF4407 domain-containing protein [Marivirga aurantiaca]MBK6265131.1 DUF4407 domain-containing protein [Marivirga aurantiaca]
MEKHKPENEPIREFTLSMRFFLFCAAANQQILKRCPSSERHKYAGVGATVFFTGLLAALSGGYAIFTVFNSIWIAVALGIFWGLLIFNLDRFIVSTIKKNDCKADQWKQVIPRLLLAVFLAVIIAKPLEIKIFEQEINERLHYTGVQKLENVDALYEQKIDKQRLAIQNLKASTEQKFELREKYYEEYKCECEGSCGTGAKGVGSECLRKEKKYLKADEEYKLAKAENDQEIAALQLIVADLNAERESYKEELQTSFASGLMAKLQALGELPPGPSWAVVMLLICIEIAPILTKLLSPYGPYDHLLKTVEYDYEIDEIATINLRNQKLNNQLTLLASVEQEKIEQQIINNKRTLHLIEEAHEELVKEQLAIWVEKEKRKLREESKEDEIYIPK